MLVLPTLHTYLSQLLSPPSIHTALLLTPQGALVSYASQTNAEGSFTPTFTHGSQGSPSSSIVASGAGGTPPSPNSFKAHESPRTSTAQDSKPGSVASIEARAGPMPRRTKDEIRMVAGLGAEVWAETRKDDEGMVESEVSCNVDAKGIVYIDGALRLLRHSWGAFWYSPSKMGVNLGMAWSRCCCSR